MQMGMIGLGRMGAAMVHRLLAGGHHCVVYDADPSAYDELAAAGAVTVDDLAQLAGALDGPRAVWIMVPADRVDGVVDAVSGFLQAGDVVIDGGNSHYADDIARASRLTARGLHYVDVGTSGGVWGRDRGYCLMIGGDDEAVALLEPLFRSLAPARDSVPPTPGPADAMGTAERGYLHCGGCGAGHFVKMVHNGIEYGMMAAYAEGFEMLNKARRPAEDPAVDAALPRLDADAARVAELWRRGSVVGSWLRDLAARRLRGDPGLDGFSGRVSDSGEGRWTVETATRMRVPVPVLSAALFQRFSSRGEGAYGNKLLSALRLAFGGHTETG